MFKNNYEHFYELMTTASYMEMMMLCDIIHFSRNIICNVGVRKRRRIISMQGYTLSSRTLRHNLCPE